MPHTINPLTFKPVATHYNVAYRLLSFSQTEFSRYKMDGVTSVEVGTLHEAAKSTAFRITMAGPDLNDDNPDTRRTFIVRVTQE